MSALLMFCLKRMFEFQPRQPLIVKTGSDISTPKQSAIGVYVCHGSTEMTIINGCPVSQHVCSHDRVPSISQNLKPFTDIGDVFI